MTSLRRVLLGMTFLLVPPWAVAEHNPLLPRPKEIHYGARTFPVRGLSVHLPLSPAPEDRFAAEQLADFLATRAKVSIPVSEARPGNRAIMLTRTRPVHPLPGFDEIPGPDSREAYELKVTPGGAEVRANSSAGEFYAVQTLCQLVEGDSGDAVIPEVEIRDWPSLAYRGIMMDLSHGPLPTEEEVERQLDFLARWKANQYYFYSEASIELEGFPLLNPAGRFTQEQVRRIIAYARNRHIDVVPCVELYGHLHDLFRIERYSDLAAVPHGSEFNPLKPQVKALLADWIGQLADLFPSPFFHVGMDETWELEKFAKSEGGGRPPGELYLRHFRTVADLVSSHNKHVMVWGDIFKKYPEIISQLPPDTTVVAWDYGPTQDYSPLLKPFAGSPVRKFIATGVTVWDEVSPDFNLSFQNIDEFLATGRQYGMTGMMNTIWCDDAQVLARSSYPGIAYGAAAAWQSEPVARDRFFSEYARRVYSPFVAPVVAPALQDLAEAETHLQKVLGQETMIAFWSDPLAPGNLKNSQAHRDDLHQTRLLAEDAQEKLMRALALGKDPSGTLSTFLVQARMLDYAAMKNLYAVEMADYWRQLGERPKREDLGFLLFAEINYHDHGRTADLMDAITELREPYRAAWLEAYTPYRLASALGKWDVEFQYWWKLKLRLDSFEANFHDGDLLPPLESLSPDR